MMLSLNNTIETIVKTVLTLNPFLCETKKEAGIDARFCFSVKLLTTQGR